jgi:hypothetical protein
MRLCIAASASPPRNDEIEMTRQKELEELRKREALAAQMRECISSVA